MPPNFDISTTMTVPARKNERERRTQTKKIKERLTEDTKNAFVWYWQNHDGEGQSILDKIEKNSISPKTPEAEIVKALVNKTRK